MTNLDFEQVVELKYWESVLLYFDDSIIVKVLASGDSSGVLTIWSLDEQDGEGALVPQVASTSLFLGS